MGFHEVLIHVADEPNGKNLIAEYSKLKAIYDEYGGVRHGYTIVAQIFGSKTGPNDYFLCGRILDPEESKAFAEILARKTNPPTAKGERG